MGVADEIATQSLLYFCKVEMEGWEPNRTTIEIVNGSVLHHDVLLQRAIPAEIKVVEPQNCVFCLYSDGRLSFFATCFLMIYFLVV